MSYAGAKSITNVELYIGGQLIESIPAEYIMLYNDICIPEENQRSVNTLGGISVFNGVSSKEFYIKVPFTSVNYGLPVGALYNQDIDVRVQFADFEKIVEPGGIQNITQYSSDTADFGRIPDASLYDLSLIHI